MVLGGRASLVCCLLLIVRSSTCSTPGDPLKWAVRGPSDPTRVLGRTPSGGASPCPQKTPPQFLEGLKNGCASGLATVCAKTALQPFDALKTVQQGSAGSLSVAAAFAEMLKRGGPGALYSGLFVSLVGSVPSVFVYFGVYQFLKVR